VWWIFALRMTGWTVADHDGEERSLRQRVGQLATLQQRFEESRVGQNVISVLLVAVVIIGVVWNLPESPIKRSLMPIAGPAGAAVYLNHTWALFAPRVPKRIETVEVHVTMSDGQVRVWSVHRGDRALGGVTSAHWLQMLRYAVTKAEIRPGIARWVARQVTGPSERAVAVEMVLRVQNLPPPGQAGQGATATKVLFQEDLTGQQ